MNIIRALSDKNRIRTIMALKDQELCICQLTDLLGLAQPTISKHMSILHNAMLVEKRKEGRWVYYLLSKKMASKDVTKALDWVLNSISLAESAEIKQDQKKIKDVIAKDWGISSRTRILFLCTGNSCCSQMAEGWTRYLKGDTIDAYSAGIETRGVNPYAVKVMAEVGVDISGHKSQHIDEFKNMKFDIVITVCGHARENCHFFPDNYQMIHHGFDDPPKFAQELAQKGASEEEQLECYRRVRDEIRAYVETL
ncbi:MAG: metalloregulator ArsR/SmtB family transcription factor [Bacteriovoracaceae bacterium]|nr:metalloregulator ArsR/SmtB family transcription factor [Bacteriovoracaceae bacterium]